MTQLPMPLAVKRVMHIGRGIKVSIGFIVTDGTDKQFSPFRDDTLAASVGEPLPLGAASRTILTGPVRIHFDGDDSCDIGFVAGMLVDLAS